MSAAADLAARLDRDGLDLVHAFQAAGGRVVFAAGAYNATAHGVRASCTAGAYQAVRRWMDRAGANRGGCDGRP